MLYLSNISTYICPPLKIGGIASLSFKINLMSKLHFTTKSAHEATVQRNWYYKENCMKIK
jgi:hypothetical protein